MAHPVNNIDYLVSNWNFLKNRYPFFAFFLFDETHADFAELFRRKFILWHEISGDGCMFFAIAPPPDDWVKSEQHRDYWQHYIANSDQQIGYSVDNVRQAARYFDIPWEYLPAVVLFKDLHDYDILTVQLVGLTQEENDSFIHNLFLFLNHPLPQRYGQLWRLQSLIDRLPRDGERNRKWIGKFTDQLWIRRRGQKRSFQVEGYDLTPLRRTHVTNNPEQLEQTLVRLAEEVERLSRDVNELRHEQQESFKQVSLQLERIEVVLQETVGRIDEFRGTFVERWVAVDTEVSDIEQARAVKEQLHAEFDDFLERQSRYLSERILQAEAEIPSAFHSLETLLEEESRQSIITAEMLWQHVNRLSPSISIDFSVCGIGLWKALEIEVNRTFVDALRIWNHLAQPGISSMKQKVQQGGKVTEDGLFGNSPGRVLLNKYDDQSGYLRSIHLGGVVGLLKNSADNSFSRILQGIPPSTTDVDTIHNSLGKLADEVGRVTDVYRNTYSHVRVMAQSECIQLRNHMLDNSHPYSPLLTTLTYKKTFQDKGLI